MSEIKLILAVGGASGSVYAQRLMEKLLPVSSTSHIAVVMTENAIINWELEIGAFDATRWPFQFYKKNDFFAPFASGSARYSTMIICPCSMGLVGRIAHGLSDDLITRAADVMLKERRKLIMVPREMPYNLIHLRNMTSLTEAGAVICPATPSFYHNPKTVIEAVDTVVDRVLDLAGLPVETKRWNDE